MFCNSLVLLTWRLINLTLLGWGLSLAFVLRRRHRRSLAAEEDGRAAGSAAAATSTTLASIEGVVGLGASTAVVALMLA